MLSSHGVRCSRRECIRIRALVPRLQQVQCLEPQAPKLLFFSTQKEEQATESALHHIHLKRVPLEDKIQETLAMPAGSLASEQINFLADSMYNLCSPDGGEGDSAIPDAALQNAERVLERIRKEHDKSVPVKLWSTLIRSAARNRDYRKAKSFVDTMEQLHRDNPDLHAPPADYHWSTVLHGCALHASDDALQLAESIISQAEANGTITIQMHNNLLLLLSNRAESVYGAAAAAEDRLLRISAAAAADPQAVQPTAATYNLVMRAWSLSPEKEGGTRADTLLQILVQVGEPDAAAFGTVIGAFSRRGLVEKCQATLDQAMEVLGDGGHDLTTCWNIACFAWAKHGDVERVEGLLDSASENVKPSLERHSAYLHLLVQKHMARQAETHLLEVMPEKIPPTTVEFEILLRSLCKRGRMSRATLMISEMVDLAENRGYRCFPKPEHVQWVLEGWLRHRTSFKSKNLRLKMLGLLDVAEPRRLMTDVSYGVIIKFLCDVKMADRGMDILRRMEKQHDEGYIKWSNTTTTVYMTLINALYKQKPSTHATTALKLLSDLRRGGKHASLLTTVQQYTTVLTNLSNFPGKKLGDITLNLLLEMFELENDPKRNFVVDSVIFERVLWNLQQHTHYIDALRIFQIMLLKYLQGRKDLEPTTSCYNAVIVALSANGEYSKCIDLVREAVERHERKVSNHLPSVLRVNKLAKMLRKKGYAEAADEFDAKFQAPSKVPDYSVETFVKQY